MSWSASAMGLLLAAVMPLTSCGGECRVLLSGGLVVSCAEVPPGPKDPAYGSAAQVLVGEDGGGTDGVVDRLWIGINDEATYAEFESLRCAGRLSWIGGTVVVADDHPHGFFFDPAEILAAEVTAEGMQTTIDQIGADPEGHTPSGGVFRQWVVEADVLAIETDAAAGCAVPVRR